MLICITFTIKPNTQHQHPAMLLVPAKFMASVPSPFNVKLLIIELRGIEIKMRNEITAAIMTCHLTFNAANEPVS